MYFLWSWKKSSFVLNCPIFPIIKFSSHCNETIFLPDVFILLQMNYHPYYYFTCNQVLKELGFLGEVGAVVELEVTADWQGNLELLLCCWLNSNHSFILQEGDNLLALTGHTVKAKEACGRKYASFCQVTKQAYLRSLSLLIMSMDQYFFPHYEWLCLGKSFHV